MTPEQYQQHVLGLLETTFPDEKFEASTDPFTINHGGMQFGLQNLFSAYTHGKLAPDERDARIREHFWRVLEAVGPEGLDALDWNEARSRLRVQFIRPEHESRVVTYKFAGELLVAIAIDRPHSFSYVSPQDLERWNVSEDVIYPEAVNNLEEASAGIEIHATEAPTRLLAIQTLDGYDAARLLLPAMRALAVEHLDEPCYAAIPNRDFLIMWSRSNPQEFDTAIRNQVSEDFKNQPYPLTADIFLVSSDHVEVEPKNLSGLIKPQEVE